MVIFHCSEGTPLAGEPSHCCPNMASFIALSRRPPPVLHSCMFFCIQFLEVATVTRHSPRSEPFFAGARVGCPGFSPRLTLFSSRLSTVFVAPHFFSQFFSLPHTLARPIRVQHGHGSFAVCVSSLPEEARVPLLVSFDSMSSLLQCLRGVSGVRTCRFTLRDRAIVESSVRGKRIPRNANECRVTGDRLGLLLCVAFLQDNWRREDCGTRLKTLRAKMS